MDRGLPIVRSAPRWLVLAVASVGGVGYARHAPGTWGSAVGALFYAAVLLPMPTQWQALAICLIIFAAWAFCDEAERRTGQHDPGWIVLDEFAAMPLVFIGIDSVAQPLRLPVLLFAGFALFRFFDVLKPLGIRRLQALPGGLGVLVDDLAAGLAACASLHLLMAIARIATSY